MAGILKISESVSLGIHAMVILTLYKDKMNFTKEIAKILDVSEAYLAKILQQLVKAGFVKSIRGPKGGFILKEGCESTKLIEIYKLLEGSLKVDQCGCRSESCTQYCSLNGLINSINTQLVEYFENTAVIDIINSHSENGKIKLPIL